jgi:hypothetical protein
MSGSSDEEFDNRDPCCGLTPEGWDRLWIVLGIVAILVTLATVLVGIILSPQRDAIHRIAVHPSAANVFPAGSGEGTFTSFGSVILNENDNSISFDLRVPPGMTSITAIHIRGPMSLLSGTWTGPLIGVLCGPLIGPGDGCDVLTSPGQVKGKVTMEIANNVDAAGVDVRPIIHDIRTSSHLYYLEVLTNAKPVSPGALRDQLDRFAGWE